MISSSVNSLDAVKALCEAGADITMEVGDNDVNESGPWVETGKHR